MIDFKPLKTVMIRYDIQLSKQPGYNIFTLGHWFIALDQVQKDVLENKNPIESIKNRFSGTIATKLIESVTDARVNNSNPNENRQVSRKVNRWQDCYC